MDEKRRGEVAYILLKYRFKREGMLFPTDKSQMARELGNIEKATGISRGELRDFLKLLAQELIDETF